MCVRHAALVDDPAQRRVEVLAVALEAEEEREVVDARDVVVELAGRDAEVGGELGGGVLHASGTARRVRIGLAAASAQHSIAIGLTYWSSSASGQSCLHVAAHVEQHGDGAQAAHDPADAERVGDRLAQAEALGDVEVDARSPGGSPPTWNEVTT